MPRGYGFSGVVVTRVVGTLCRGKAYSATLWLTVPRLRGGASGQFGPEVPPLRQPRTSALVSQE
jgi:hypothetical protein